MLVFWYLLKTVVSVAKDMILESTKMLPAATSVALFLISVRILPQKEGLDVSAIIINIAKFFEDHYTDVTFLYMFKVNG